MVSSAGSRAQVRRSPLGRVLGQVEAQLSRRIEKLGLVGRGLTVDQWRVLDLLADGRGYAMSQIAEAVVVPGPTLTRLVDKLVDAALAYRLVDDHDRRRVRVFISDKGKAFHAEVLPDVAAVEAEALGVLGPDGDVLLDLLAHLAESGGRDGK